MEKISNLIYEYYGKPEGHYIDHSEQWQSYYYVSEIGNEVIEHIPAELLISKKCGFIKWLVENEKVDFSNLKIDELTSGTDLFYSFSTTEVLLMLLSIQDNPIEFLISILK